MRILVAFILPLVALAGCLGESPDPPAPPVPQDMNGDGIVVVAVLDGGFNPYILDMVGSHMPQHRNNDPRDDLPLDRPPHEWIPDFPDPAEFAGYIELDLDYEYAEGEVDLSLTSASLRDADADAWGKEQSSSSSSINYHYIPGSKVIGMVNFGGTSAFAVSSHGVGTSTVSVGNYHGSCPTCLLVFVDNGGGETPSNWILDQDWIDAQTNSFGYSLINRDRMYAGSDTVAQREATEAGQAIFFSAGNGQANAFTVPNPTLFSSQEGPDWVVTVGAIHPTSRDSYSGHGKPADVASIGSQYPSGGYCDGTINCTGNFGGTSNATPVTAGMYAEALQRLRFMANATRSDEPAVLVQLPAGCGEANPDCANADGNITIHELFDALFAAAEHKSTSWVVGLAGVETPIQTAEMQFLAEGHGSFLGILEGRDVWGDEVSRILDVVLGHAAPEYAAGELDWFINDSYCRQSIWGDWEYGDYDGSNLPLPDPLWPARAALMAACPTVVALVVDVEQIKDGGT